MQSIFRLPWCTDHFGAGEKGFAVGIPPVDVANIKKLKRKRAVTPDPQETTPKEIKKQRPATARSADYFSTVNVPRTPAATPPVEFKISIADDITLARTNTTPTTSKINITPESLKTTKMTAVRDVTMVDVELATDKASRMKQAIENQFNLQILMKHNELRLIEQELAKCQIALEQLRRCELRPYPGNEGFDYAVSSGMGASIEPPTGYTRPAYAAPHGVVDGPYTRHYQRWLLPDSSFDAQPVHVVSPAEDNTANRSTRHAGARKSVTMPPPPRSDGLQSLPAHPIPVAKKDNTAPLVLRRSTDNKLVKLVCNNCNRGNMSSIQGFLNHCRIAHKVVYESHDAAAIDCGRALDDQEIANLPTETQTMGVSKPVARHTPSRAASIAGPSPSASTFVHPLNRENVTLASQKSKVVSSAKPVVSMAAPQPSHIATAPFKAAAGLPKLSALFARRNCGGNLEQAAVEARRKSDLVEDIISPASLTPGSPAVATPIAGRGMFSSRGIGSKAPPRPQQSYFATTQQDDNAQSPRDSNLSPHTDSNPGLVSDVEDDDTGSASEEESHAHAPIALPLGVRRDCADNMDIDVAVEHGVVIRRNSMLSAEDRNVEGSARKFGGS